MRNQWVKLGGLLGIAYCIAGFVLIFLGWNGTASKDDVPAQIPYVVSGGIAGLGLVVVGAALIVAHSLRTDRVELRAAIDDLRAADRTRRAGAGCRGECARRGVGRSKARATRCWPDRTATTARRARSSLVKPGRWRCRGPTPRPPGSPPVGCATPTRPPPDASEGFASPEGYAPGRGAGNPRMPGSGSGEPRE